MHTIAVSRFSFNVLISGERGRPERQIPGSNLLDVRGLGFFSDGPNGTLQTNGGPVRCIGSGRSAEGGAAMVGTSCWLQKQLPRAAATPRVEVVVNITPPFFDVGLLSRKHDTDSSSVVNFTTRQPMKSPHPSPLDSAACHQCHRAVSSVSIASFIPSPDVGVTDF